MNRDYDVICIGLLAANILIHPVSKTIFDTDVSLVDKMNIIPGGDALNQAIILARLGRKVSLCGKIGPDVFGRYLTDEVKKNNAGISTMIIDADECTSSCAVLVQTNGSRNFLSYRGANEKFSLREIPEENVFNTRIISIGSLLALPLLHGTELTGFLKKAKEHGCVTAVDTKHDTYRIGWEGIKESLSYVDYFLPSYDEASYLSGETDPGRIAGFFLEAGVKNVIIKLGIKGCYLRSADYEQAIPTIDAETIDTTGAGDNFVAGFLHAVLYGWDIKKCCDYANAVGAISTTKIGATTAVESEVQVIDYTKTHHELKRSV